MTEIKTRSLGWINSRLVPFDESYIDNLKKSQEFGHFIDEMHEMVNHYISNTPYKGANPKDEILLEKNLITREKRMNFVYNYAKSPIVPKIESYVRSFNSGQQFELLKKGKVGDYLPPKEQKKIDQRLLQIKEIRNPKERLKDLYFLWIELYERFFLNGCFDYPLGRKIPGDILSDEVENLEKEINRVYKNAENSVFDLLYDPKFEAYEIELNLDTLDFLSSLTEKTGSDIEIIQELQKITCKDTAEKLFIYSKKHFDGSVIRTLNQLVKYQNIKPKEILKKLRKRENELAINYSSTMEKLSIDKSNKESKKQIMKSLKKIKFLMYNDFYIQSKLLNIPDRKDSLCFTWLTVDQQLKDYLRQIDPKIKDENLSNFTGLETNVRSILKIDVSAYDEIWEKVRKDFELEVGG
jgi:hypothetical protein